MPDSKLEPPWHSAAQHFAGRKRKERKVQAKESQSTSPHFPPQARSQREP